MAVDDRFSYVPGPPPEDEQLGVLAPRLQAPRRS